jgi:aconitase B
MDDRSVAQDRRDRLKALATETRSGLARDAAARAGFLAAAADEAKTAPETPAAEAVEAIGEG